MATMFVESTDGVELALHDLGGEGDALLLSHATGFHGYVWQPLAEHLAPRYHSWALDYRGHGDSSAPASGSYDWSGMRADAEAAVRAIDASPLFAMGHSMGGTALLMTELAHPGTFAAIALFEPIVFPPDRQRPEGGIPLVDVARRRREVFASRDEAYENYAAKPPLDLVDPAALRAYVDHGFVDQPDGTVLLKCRGESEARTFEGSASQDVWSALDRVRCPVLVIAGAPAPFQPADWAEQAASRLPDGTYLQLDLLGHFGPMEDPALVGDVAADFFTKHA
jgi:pimeloyl-ACP methyl ester carboxylesterase